MCLAEGCGGARRLCATGGGAEPRRRFRPRNSGDFEELEVDAAECGSSEFREKNDEDL